MKSGSSIRIVIIVLCLLTYGLRFATLLADFPPGIDWSGDLYSDEGWYAGGAVSHYLTGNWYVAGDYNTITNVPVFQFIQAFTFSILGMSLAAARTTEVLFTLLLTVLTYFIVRRSWDEPAALLCSLLLSINFYLFAFSKLALLEIPMITLVLLDILLIEYSTSMDAWRVALAAFIYSVALLTKTTASFGLPVLLVLFWLKPTGIKNKIWSILGFLLGVGLLYGGYYLWVNHFFPVDYHYFNDEFLSPRFTPTVGYFLYTALRIIWNGKVIDFVLFPLACLAIPAGLVIVRRFRTNPLVLACLTWIGVYSLILLTRGYLPPRYYLPLSVPVIILTGILAIWTYHFIASAQDLEKIGNALEGQTLSTPRRWALRKGWKYLPFGIITIICVLNLFSMVQYVATQKFTYITMVHDVEQRVKNSSETNKMLLGWITHTISIEAGFPALNSKYGTRDLAWKLQTYHPGFYVGLEADGEDHSWLSGIASMELLASYDVLGNYYAGKRVYLYRLHY